MRDDHPVFADADAADGGRAETAGDFRDAPECRLVDAVVLRGVQRMFFYEIEALAQLECAANGLAIVFADAEQAVDAVVAFRIFDAAGANDGIICRRVGWKDFDGVDVELAVEIWGAVGVDAQLQIGWDGCERRGEFGDVLDVICGELQAGGVNAAAGAEEMNV